MNENLVQWTLLNNLDFLSDVLEFKISKKIGQEVSTDFGRIDFILQDLYNTKMIVELETELSSKNKLDYCIKQVSNYKNIIFPEKTIYCILYASETSQKNSKIIKNYGKNNNVEIKTYSINDIKNLYSQTIEKFSLNYGLALPKPTNYTISYLRWLNKVLKPYKDFNKTILSEKELSKYFKSFKNNTNYNCYKKLALDFEMIIKNSNGYEITQNGKYYIDNFNPEVEYGKNFSFKNINLSSIDLSIEQKKIILKILTNGYWTSHKINIFWFLKYIEITQGNWLPKSKNIDNSILNIINELFGKTYKPRTAYEFLLFAFNWCNELGLVEKVKSTSKYDNVFLTPLGVEINNIFSLDLLLKKNRMNLNFKYLE